MNNKKVQKLNRAAVAAVLATSGVAVTMPYTVVKADSPFTDLTTANSHYNSIMKLYNRGIISGFEDQTFRPAKSVTRGQAAKMLALTLGLDVYNVKNPKFKDVPQTSGYYPYIAALVQEGIISGYVDNTFRPGEVITRNQMAKILVKGFKFGETVNLTHTFQDVTNKNANRFYIQTLVNLGITSGTSAVTFSPNKPVTRAQLSSFLIRAEEANVQGAQVKEITKIEQKSGVTYVYLNGVKHTVSTNLRDILNTKNTETLKGAHIEGTIVASEIRTLGKITFNAVGAANNVLTFDGNGSTYRGAVEITGNHLRFSNWTIIGEVTIKPETAKTFSNIYKPLAVKSIAALQVASDNIDWGSTTPPSQIETDENDGLIEVPTGNKPALPKMRTVEHDIQFVNVKMQALVITANRTKVRSNLDLAHVTVGGYVREFELHTDVNELYIESDDNVTFYGVADINKLYKNSYKSVNLYADSITNLIATDNANGWIDLGDYYYVDKIIIPPNTLPHDIFNDFMNDSDKIGDIEDPSGNDIDRDPIENGIVPDWEPPVLTIKNAQTNLATVNVTVNSNEDGIVHYLVKREKDGEPSIREIMQYTGPMGGTKAVSEGQDSIITVTGLQDQEKYIIYAVAVDEAGNVSKKVSEAFEILDATPPNITPVSAEGMPGGTRIKVSMNPNEAGEYYYYYDRLITQPRQYTTEEILQLVEDRDSQAGKGTVTEAGPMDFRITGLLANTTYVVYVVMKDKAGNVMAEPVMVSAVTGALDLTPPRVTEDGLLVPSRNSPYEFEFNVTEELDFDSANDISNYELSGTAILNIDGQPTTIKPDYVEYQKGSKTIKIRIPSATALVNGDTIVVKVLPGVKDLAENEFSNINNDSEPFNKATYIHSDYVKPELTIEDYSVNPAATNGTLTFKANKAGTYYYMIVPNSFNMDNYQSKDFYRHFTDRPEDIEADKLIPYIDQYGTVNTVVVGSQSIPVSLQTQKTPDPFESYSLYMIMKDRSGQLSEIVKQEDIIADNRAPFIKSVKVDMVAGTNDTAKISLNSSEAGKVYFKRFKLDGATQQELDEIAKIRSWETSLAASKENHSASVNGEVLEAVANIRSWDWRKLNKDVTEIDQTGLAPHTNYVYFFAAEDNFGNITIFSSTSVMENNVLVDKHSTDQMEVPLFTDGIYPYIEPKTLRLITKGYLDQIGLTVNNPATPTLGDGAISHEYGKTFVLSFSEAVKLANGATNLNEGIRDSIQTALRKYDQSITVTDIEWEPTANLKTWEPRDLVFTVNQKPTQNLKIVAEDFANITDISDKEFGDVDGKQFLPSVTEKLLAEYKKSTDINNIIVGARLNGDTTQIDTNVYQSDSVLISTFINVPLGLEQKAFYVVQNLATQGLNNPVEIIYTAEEVVDINLYPAARGNIGGGIHKYGFKDVPMNLVENPENSGQGTSYSFEILVTGQDVFNTLQKVHLVTMDKYGNIVRGVTKDNPPMTYLQIKRFTENP